MAWLAMDIGCIECGESSEVLGVFDTEEAADAMCKEMKELGWRGGQHSYEVFDLKVKDAE